MFVFGNLSEITFSYILTNRGAKMPYFGEPLGPGGSKGDLKSMATERHRNSEQGGATLPTCFPGSLSSLSGAPFWPISDEFCD